MFLDQLAKDFEGFHLNQFVELKDKRAVKSPLTPQEQKLLKKFRQQWISAKAKYPFTEERRKILQDQLDLTGSLPDMGMALLKGFYWKEAERGGLQKRGQELVETTKKRHSIEEYEVMLAELERDDSIGFSKPGTDAHERKTKWLKNVRRLKKRRGKRGTSDSNGGAK